MNTYIPPTGTIQMLTDVYLNPKQEDTFYFASVGLRDSYFDLRVLRTYEAQTYSRPTRESVKIQDTADKLYKCNYMRFKNGEAFGGQWIYAFVIKIEYINNNTCEVFYQIDDLITWFPQCRLLECFVEREIPETDNLFENTLPENIETGEYVINDDTEINLGKSWYSIQSKTLNGDMGLQWIDGLLSSVLYSAAPADKDLYSGNPAPSETFLYEILHQFDERPEDLITIHIVPYWLIGRDGTEILKSGAKIEEKTIVYDLNPPNYTIKNKKLYSAPFTYLCASNNNGQINRYSPELFNSLTYSEGMAQIKFTLCGTYLGNPSILLYPNDYKSIKDNYDEGVPLTNFPVAPWVTDSYQAYLAQNRASITSTFVSSAITTALGVAQGNASMAWSGASNAAGTVAKIVDAQLMPKNVSTLAQSDNIQTTMGRCRYNIYKMQPKTELIKIIDDYFSMYGYTQNKVKKPNINSRPFWNYTKTKNCTIMGDAPASALANISSIFDRGIRFWKNPLNIGNYSLNNQA